MEKSCAHVVRKIFWESLVRDVVRSCAVLTQSLAASCMLLGAVVPPRSRGRVGQHVPPRPLHKINLRKKSCAVLWGVVVFRKIVLCGLVALFF